MSSASLHRATFRRAQQRDRSLESGFLYAVLLIGSVQALLFLF